MFENIPLMLREIAVEVSTEVAGQPMRLLAEVVQFAVLLGIVWVVAFGFARRRGFVANMLSERRTRVEARVVGASHAEKSLADAKHEAGITIRGGRAKARETIALAKKECDAIKTAAQAETDADCSRIQERAQSALVTEQQEMLLELREQLVELVSTATRSIMNEKLTVAEQRKLIESTIVGSVKASAGTDARAEALAAGALPERASR